MNGSSVQSMEPVFIWAPVPRCGTGLVQRLITSSRQVLIFGEDAFFVKMLPAALMARMQARSEVDSATHRLASGQKEGWYPSALPQYRYYGPALELAFRAVCMAYHSACKNAGFERWGCKYPGFSPGEYKVIGALLPKARHIFLYRNPLDAMRSIKARGWLKSIADAERFSSAWVNSVGWVLDAWRSGQAPAMHVVRYEWLCENRQRECDAIKDFLGIESVDLDVFEHRVNTFKGKEADGHSPSGYIRPQKLSRDELKVIQDIAGDLMAKLGYEGGSRSKSCSAA
ncbi:MAG: sulfotransferase [Deltaproteobacteria bacterium]|nr:MAG: sulfotransferase [Deltaproteobacteria bacterium]